MHGAWQFVALASADRADPVVSHQVAGAGRFVGRAADSCSSSGAASSGGRASCHGVWGSCRGRARVEFRGGGTGLTNGEHRRRGRIWGERGSRRQGCADTLAEELERYTVVELKAELRARQMLVGGLKEDLTRRLSREAAGEATYKVACTIARRSGVVIPLGALRSDETLAAWCQQRLQQL